MLLSCLFFSCSKLKVLKQKKTTKIKTQKQKKVYAGPSRPAIIKSFKEVAADYGLKGISGTNFYAVDFDNDKFTDLIYLPSHFSPPVFMRYSPSKLRFEKMNYNPFPELIRASYLVFVDLDKDGLLDVLVATLNQKTELSKNNIRLFRAYKRGSKVFYARVLNDPVKNIEPTASVVFMDYDLDGQLDMYVGNWFDNSGTTPMPVPDRLLKGEGFNFKDVSALLNNEWKYSKSIKRYVNAAPVFGVTVCDLDQNGYPDILSSVSSGYKNKLWMNVSLPGGRGRHFQNFGEASEFAEDRDGRFIPRGGGNSFYSACADYNNDGIMDLAVGELTHSYDPEIRDRSAFLTGSSFEFPPRFIRTEYHMDDGTGEWNQGDRRGVFIDYNMDGLEDLIVDNSGFPPSSRLILFKQEENHAFIDMADTLGVDIINPSGTITLDIDRDGRPDFLTGQTKIRNSLIDDKIYLFQNIINKSGQKTYKLFLRGKKSNSGGWGALIVLKTDKSTYRRYINPSYGPLPSQYEEGVLFALQQDEKVESLDIRWPYLLKEKGKRAAQLIKRYAIEKFKSDGHLELTLCESGKIIKGRRQCL